MARRGWLSDLELLADDAADEARNATMEMGRGYAAHADSPIERIFAAHLVGLPAILEREANLATRLSPIVKRSGRPTKMGDLPGDWRPPYDGTHGLRVWFQQRIGSYRVDALVVASFVDRDQEHHLQIVVECDGHDFHERTKEQAAKDRARDRALTLGGYRVLRFTGSELFNDARQCLRELADHIAQFFNEVAS